jgi:hypothetical protein
MIDGDNKKKCDDKQLRQMKKKKATRDNCIN